VTGTYTELDARIIGAIRHNSHPLYNSVVRVEAERIAQLTGRETFRVIDGRLIALRKAGRIKFVRGKGSQWVVAQEQPK
jgi:hypothetical protein